VDRGLPPAGDFSSFFWVFVCLLQDGETGVKSRSQNKVLPRSIPIPAESKWNYLSGGSLGFWSVIVLVGVVASLAFLIYCSHYLAMVATLVVIWALAQQFSICLLQQTLLQQALAGSSDKGARTARAFGSL
jgi:hypothetical protein